MEERCISYEDLNYSSSDFVSSEEEMVKCIKKIDSIIGENKISYYSANLFFK